MPTKIPLVPPRVQALIPFIGRSRHPAPFKKFTKDQGRHACELQTLGGGKFLYRGIFKSPFWEGPPSCWNLYGFGCYWAVGRFVYDEGIGGRKVLSTDCIKTVRILGFVGFDKPSKEEIDAAMKGKLKFPSKIIIEPIEIDE